MKSISCFIIISCRSNFYLEVCLLWKETFLSLRQVNVYFLILIVGVSSFCAGINYFHTSGQKRHSILHSQKKVWMVLYDSFGGQLVSILSGFIRKYPNSQQNYSRIWLIFFYRHSFFY